MEATVASLKAFLRDSSTKISILEEELSTKLEQLQESKDEIALLRATIEDLDLHAAQLSIQVAKVRKKVTLAKGEVAEARRKAATAKEMAKSAKDVVAVAADAAQDIGL